MNIFRAKLVGGQWDGQEFDIRCSLPPVLGRNRGALVLVIPHVLPDQVPHYARIFQGGFPPPSVPGRVSYFVNEPLCTEPDGSVRGAWRLVPPRGM